MDFRVEPAGAREAQVRVPGDKSISHRAVMLGSLAEGTTEVSGFLPGEDCLATLRAFRDMGVEIHQSDPTSVVIHGVGFQGLRAPRGPLDLGNSGTAMRLMCGVLAGQPFDTTLIGDESLSGRPMSRVIRPLELMGARIRSRDGLPPLEIAGGSSLSGIDYDMPVASAQVKSCVLLAGLFAAGETSVREPAVTRDHTERLLGAMGVEVVRREGGHIGLSGGQRLKGVRIEVPGDLSSATFLILAALLSDDADVLIEGVGVNPTRTGVLEILRGMGARLEIAKERMSGGEPLADIRVRSSKLEGGDVDPALVPLAIDEFPALFVAAAAASGRTRFSGIGELRVKESDRIAAMAAGLQALGIQVDESADGATVHGGRLTGGAVDSHGDHRIAMSLAIAGSIAEGPVLVRDVAAVDTSFPGFVPLCRSLGLAIDYASGEG
jgi:3-phosphoshikimate 1-carboxyvinyltransferase